MADFSTSANWQPGTVQAQNSPMQNRQAPRRGRGITPHVENNDYSMSKRGTYGSHGMVKVPGPVSTQQPGRGRLTMESLAAFEAAYQKANPLVEDDPESDQTADVRKGRTMSDFFTEVFPNDSFSELGGNMEQSGGTQDTGGEWMNRASQVFATPRDFHKSVKVWTANIHPTPPLNESDQQKWRTYDTEPDPLSCSLIHPPQAPEILIDPAQREQGPESRRATQTAQSSCLRYSILAQTGGLQPDGPGPQTATSREDTQKTAAKAERSPSPALPQSPEDAADDMMTPAILPDKPTTVYEVLAPVKEVVHDTPAVATLPSSASVSIRIAAANEGHLDQVLDIYQEEFSNVMQTDGQHPISIEGVKRFYSASRQFKLPFLVALAGSNNGELVLGVALLQPRPMVGISEPQDLYCANCSILVRTKYRNRGIGQELLSTLISAVMGYRAPLSKPNTDTGNGLNDVDNVSLLGPTYKFVREVAPAFPEIKSYRPLIHYIIIDVVCGNVNGMVEKKHLEKLTQKFEFKYGDVFDDVIWAKEGPTTVKKIMFFRLCRPVGLGVQEQAQAGDDSSMITGGPVLPLPAQPAGTIEAVSPVKTATPDRIMDPSRDDARFLPRRLLNDLMAVPATTNTYGHTRMVPVFKPAAAKAAEAAAAAGFW
ncbi:hypothetical protein SEUCBS139899_004854 [Sporothrix eucalyptigena]